MLIVWLELLILTWIFIEYNIPRSSDHIYILALTVKVPSKVTQLIIDK